MFTGSTGDRLGDRLDRLAAAGLATCASPPARSYPRNLALSPPRLAARGLNPVGRCECLGTFRNVTFWHPCATWGNPARPRPRGRPLDRLDRLGDLDRATSTGEGGGGATARAGRAVPATPRGGGGGRCRGGATPPAQAREGVEGGGVTYVTNH